MKKIDEILKIHRRLTTWAEKTDDLVDLNNLKNLSSTELDSIIKKLKKRDDELSDDVMRQHAEGVAGYAAYQAKLRSKQNK